ncbi:MAG: VWA domain-containing protein [Thermoplasmata archaeon]|nr:VWA domain-containing protein [Thermoplasmata archaeon]
MAVPFGPPGPTLSRSVVLNDPFDVEAFEEVLPRAPGLRLLLEPPAGPETKDLAFDLFSSFYKYFVKLLPAEQIVPECRRHLDLIGRALGLREHEKLRTLTRLKPIETAMATELVLDILLKDVPADEAKPPGKKPEETGAEERAQSSPEADISTERIREALRDAREDLEGAVELIAAWSSGPGDETRLPADVKLRLLRDLVRNPRLRRIARLFGRYQRMGLRDRDLKAVLASEEVVDFVQGGEVARALSGELVNFAIDEREDLFYAKVVTHQLLIYELWQRHQRPRPVYLCLDNSGSMSGEKEIWAKAAALALAHMALQHGRSVEIVLFGDAADPLRVVPLHPEDDGPTRLSKVIDVASYFLGGGTDFVKPLSHVLEEIAASDVKAGNDVLFVSDGLCPLPDEFVRQFLEAKARRDIRLTTVVIGGEPFSLAPISDSLHRLEDTLDSGDALAAQFASAFLERTPGPGFRSRGRPRADRGQPLLFDHFLPDEP